MNRIKVLIVVCVAIIMVGVFGFLYWNKKGAQEVPSSQTTETKSDTDHAKKQKEDTEPTEVEQKIKPVVKREKVKIGFTTDAHCYSSNSKKTNYEWKLNWRCREPMEDFIEKMNNDFMPDFVVDGGDFTDGKDERSKETFLDYQKLYETVQAPHHYVLGNHEMRGITVDEWLEFVDYESAYYFFDMKGYRFIVLDGNHRPNPDGSIEHTSRNNYYYPGLIDREQLAWLKETLAGAVDSGLASIVFVHQPPIGIDSRDIEKLFYNGKELQEIFSKNNVQAVFSGHIERVCNTEIDGVEYYVIPGFWKGNDEVTEEHEFRNAGIFSEITLEENDIKVSMYHRTREKREYQVMDVNQETANCFDGSTLLPGQLEEIIE